tara:strand:+ start:220977 stop:221270 length:294 start_codon:yes stop_codon:yes gene_type:complete
METKLDVLTTRLGTEIPITARGILYLCQYDYENQTIEVMAEKITNTPSEALELYCNIPNPESQLVTGATFDELIIDLIRLHKNLDDKKWVVELANYL